MYSDQKFPKKNGRLWNCDFDANYDTNLNGVYKKEEKLSQRTIGICNQNMPLDKCFHRKPDGIYEFRGTAVKLAETRMFLGREPSRSVIKPV